MSTIARLLKEIHQRFQNETGGALANYIPELTRADPSSFGISLVTSDGHRYSVGDSSREFTIQSISKPFGYGLALDVHGMDAVLGKIGVEPSGEAFNEISLETGTGRPFNPMINAGAIAATALVPGPGMAERFENLRRCLSAYAGRELGVDESVYRSESDTGFRNRAIAYLLRNNGIIGDPVEDAVEAYFRQCAVLVSSDDLAVMGATLAAGGVNPITGQRAIQHDHVDKVLSIMATCGMYNASGEWMFRVGFPAKSGVGGGILGVLPGQMGLAVYSPLLDPKGNSVRGLGVFLELSRRFGLHLFNLPALSDQSIRTVYQLSSVDSTRQRPKEDREIIRRHGDQVVIIEMQGDLFFSSLERALRIAQVRHASCRTVVLDISRVGTIDPICQSLLQETVADLGEDRRQLVVVDPKNRFQEGEFQGAIRFFGQLQVALDKAEREIVAEHSQKPALVTALVPFQDFEIFSGLQASELVQVERLLEMQSYRPEEAIVRQGEDPDYLYLLAKGGVAVYIRTGESRQRIQAFSAGVSFGDQALIDHRKRSADIVAETETVCYQISAERFYALEREAPAIFTRIIRNLFRVNLEILRACSRELATWKQSPAWSGAGSATAAEPAPGLPSEETGAATATKAAGDAPPPGNAETAKPRFRFPWER